MLREVGPPDLDGRRWRFLATDGKSQHVIEGQLSGSSGGMPGVEFKPAALEMAIERTAGRFPREVRLARMAADSPLNLRAEDLRG